MALLQLKNRVCNIVSVFLNLFLSYFNFHSYFNSFWCLYFLNVLDFGWVLGVRIEPKICFVLIDFLYCMTLTCVHFNHLSLDQAFD